MHTGCIILRVMQILHVSGCRGPLKLQLLYVFERSVLQVYYTLCELLPSALVLYILRKLPPRRAQQGYQQIPAR